MALLLADIDNDLDRAVEILRPWEDAGPVAAGALIGALVTAARYLAVDWAGRTPEELRAELQLIAEGFAMGD